MLKRIALLGLAFCSLQAPAYFRYLVMHSQTTQDPTCPGGWTQMWRGFSTLAHHLHDNGSSQQDLASPGSCMAMDKEKFLPLPFIECNLDRCDYKSPLDSTNYLSTKDDTTKFTQYNTDQQANADKVMARVSRCSVCQGKKPIMVRHSLTGSNPGCPTGWTSLWDGYSLAMISEKDGKVSPQDLGDTGSCLQFFDPAPIIYCNDANYCAYHQGQAPYAMWLLNQDKASDTSSKAPDAGRIGHCSVCQKN